MQSGGPLLEDLKHKILFNGRSSGCGDCCDVKPSPAGNGNKSQEREMFGCPKNRTKICCGPARN